MNTAPELLLEQEITASDPIPSHRNSARLTPPVAGRPNRFQAVVIGTLTGISEEGRPIVDFPENPSGKPIPVRSTVAMKIEDLGREVVLMFESADAGRPIIVGLVQPASMPEVAPVVEARMDGEQLTLTAKHEIVLRCGKASITLTRAGKVLIRGAYVLSRSSGANRIKGGSVQIN
jgi:hypothetical protein